MRGYGSAQYFYRTGFRLPSDVMPTAPVAAGGLVYLADESGVVRALEASSGKPRWNAYTGSAVFFPPAVWEGRVYVGSADGWVYAFGAATGRPLWRFRAAPRERRIPVFGKLISTWPVVKGGMAVDHKARIVVSLEDGRVLCFAARSVAVPSIGLMEPTPSRSAPEGHDGQNPESGDTILLLTNWEGLHKFRGMARLARVVIPGMPHHVTQRGHRRQQAFCNDGDYAEHDVSGAIGASRRSRAKTSETRPETQISQPAKMSIVSPKFRFLFLINLQPQIWILDSLYAAPIPWLLFPFLFHR